MAQESPKGGAQGMAKDGAVTRFRVRSSSLSASSTAESARPIARLSPDSARRPCNKPCSQPHNHTRKAT